MQTEQTHAPEPLYACGVVVRFAGKVLVAHGIRLRSCPGLAVAEALPGSWVVVYDALALGTDGPSQGARKVSPAGFVAPWVEALRFMRAAAATGIDWMQPAPRVSREGMPPLGPGWIRLASVENRAGDRTHL